MKNLLLICILFAGLAPAIAQETSNPAIEKLSFLEGKWSGPAWVSLGPNNSKTLAQKEDVKLMLNNNVLHVEGIGSENGKEVFHALGIVSYNKQTEKYNFRAYRENGMSTDAYFTPKGEKWFEWGFDMGNGAKVRYNIQINEKGQWHEVGEFSPDGNKWYKNFEMTLDKTI
jgi:hypothetical protein